VEFINLDPITLSEASDAFASQSSNRIIDALLRLSHFPIEYDQTEQACLTYLDSEDFEVRRIAVLALGHLARTCRFIDKGKIIPILKAMGKDPTISGTVEDALDDIEIFAR
jgi:hypothetical protein